MKNSEQDDNKVISEEMQSGGRKNSIYMLCVLVFLVALAVVSFIIDKKMKASDEIAATSGSISENVSLTVYGEMSREELLEETKITIVRIEAAVPNISDNEETLQGSGVIIEMTDDYIDIATASHVVEQTATPLVYFYDGSLAYGSVLAYGKESDVAFVRVKEEDLSEGIGDMLKAAVYADNDAYEALQPEDNAFLIGSVTQVAGNVVNGTIKEKAQFVELFQNHMLICEATVLNGMSGGGTFSSDGMLIGVIVGTNGSDAVSVAIPDVMSEYRSISF